MSTTVPQVISEENLSYAWGRAFLTLMQRSKDLMPLTISIGGLTNGLPDENCDIRQALDEALIRNGKYNCAISAMTIFPFRYWNLSGRPHILEFTDLYLNKYLPRLKALNSRNRIGTYFERMIAFEGIKRKGGNDTKNQLHHIIALWPRRGMASRPRRSALQVAIFDPVKDHNGSPRSIFPCLQQVSFAYDNAGRLAVNAY